MSSTKVSNYYFSHVYTTSVFSASMIVRKVYKDHDPSIDESGVIDIAVSYDSTWMTRGHKSMHGIGRIVEVVTGLVIDFTILSLYCQSCSAAATRYGSRETKDFQDWHQLHNDCNVNYTGSSGGMEVEAVEILWKQSIDRHNFRYTTMVSDGDSRSYIHLCAKKVSGDDVEIVKEECVNNTVACLPGLHRVLVTGISR